MLGFARMGAHAELVNGMADAIGVDMAEEVLAGRVRGRTVVDVKR